MCLGAREALPEFLLHQASYEDLVCSPQSMPLFEAAKSAVMSAAKRDDPTSRWPVQLQAGGKNKSIQEPTVQKTIYHPSPYRAVLAKGFGRAATTVGQF